MFLTLEDPRAKIQGSRDPLGVQPIWARFGRDVVTNLTTVSRAVRGFTVMLLGRYYTERLVNENRAGEEDAIPIFLRAEQIAAYARYVRQPEGESDRILGVTRVARFLDEHDGKVPIRNSTAGFILSDQKTYGLWGLYSVASRVSGLLADGPVGLTDWARQFVEQHYVSQLRSHENNFVKLIRDGGTLDVKKGRQPFESVARILQPELSADEARFYGEALRDAERVERPSAPQRQKQLAALILSHSDPTTEIGREGIGNFSFLAEQSGASSLADKLGRILRVEATLAPADALFDRILARNGQSPAALAAHVTDHWGSRVPNVSGPIEPIMSEIRNAVGHDQARALQRCDAAFDQGDYQDAIHTLLDWNRLVMESRGAAPWVKLTSGELDVRYRSVEQDCPAGEDLPLLWRNSYFIDALKDVTFQLENKR